MYYLIQRNPMNLPFMMMQQIKDATGRSKTKACLPHGMVFTLIFIDSETNLEGEDFKVLAHTDFYPKRSLHHMGYQKVDDQWMHEGDDDLGMHQIEGTPSSSPSSLPPSPPSSAVGPSSPAPTPTSVAVVEHFTGASISPHTPHMHRTFSIEGS